MKFDDRTNGDLAGVAQMKSPAHQAPRAEYVSKSSRDRLFSLVNALA